MLSSQFSDEDPNTLDLTLPWAENKTNNDDEFMIINTNARSLAPKMNSFIECCRELDCKLAIVTETWLGSSEDHEQDIDDVLQSTGIQLITRNRPPTNSGVCYGGVAIAYRAASLTLKEIGFANPDSYEVIYACLLYTSDAADE